MNSRKAPIAAPISASLDDFAGLLGVLDEIMDQRVDPPGPGVTEHGDRSGGQVRHPQHPRPHGVVDVVVDVRDPVDQPNDPALKAARLLRTTGVRR